MGKKEGDNMDMSFLSHIIKEESIKNALEPVIVRDGEDKIIEETYYWVSDFDDEFVYVEKITGRQMIMSVHMVESNIHLMKLLLLLRLI